MRIDAAALVKGRTTEPEAEPPARITTDVLSEVARLEREKEELIAALKAAQAKPVEATPETPKGIPGEVLREQVGDETIVVVKGEWRGQPTLGAFKLRPDGTVQDMPIRDMRHIVPFWTDVVNAAAIRLCQEAAHSDSA